MSTYKIYNIIKLPLGCLADPGLLVHTGNVSATEIQLLHQDKIQFAANVSKLMLGKCFRESWGNTFE